MQLYSVLTVLDYCFVCLLLSNNFCMDLDSVLQRVKSFPGVVGHVIVDSGRNVVHTSLEKEEAISLAAVTIKEFNIFIGMIM